MRNKLSLDIDSLQVEAFQTTVGGPHRGTVLGHTNTYEGDSCETTCLQIICACTYGGPHNGTCNASCGGTCFHVETCEWPGCDFSNLNCPTGAGRPGC